MATTNLRGTVVSTVGEPPAVGEPLIPFRLTLPDLTEFASAELTGRRVVLNIFPSIDTRVCALSVRRFNEQSEGGSERRLSSGVESIESVVTGGRET